LFWSSFCCFCSISRHISVMFEQKQQTSRLHNHPPLRHFSGVVTDYSERIQPTCPTWGRNRNPVWTAGSGNCLGAIHLRLAILFSASFCHGIWDCKTKVEKDKNEVMANPDRNSLVVESSWVHDSRSQSALITVNIVALCKIVTLPCGLQAQIVNQESQYIDQQKRRGNEWNR